MLTIMAAWSLLSTAFSEGARSSFLGVIGWFMGSLMLVILMFSTFYYSEYLHLSEKMLIPVMGVNTLIILFEIVQMAGKDPFGFIAMIKRVYRFSYLSTIGQINVLSGYLCLLLPLFWGLFCEAQERRRVLAYSAFCALGFMAIIGAGSDSTFAGIGVCAIFLMPYFLHKRERLKRASFLIIMYGICLLLVGRLPVFADKVEHIVRHKTDISAILLRLPVSVGVILAGCLLYFATEKWMTKDYEKKARIFLIAAEILIFSAAVAVVLYTIPRFNDKWGTNRGYIWRVGLEQFRGFTLRRKLMGVGPDLLAPVYVELRILLKTNVVSAHCEPLQILLTQGVVGLLLYLMFWGYLIMLFVRNSLWRGDKAKYFFPLAAFLGQSMFCTDYPVTGAMFSLMAGLYLHEVETRRKEEFSK